MLCPNTTQGPHRNSSPTKLPYSAFTSPDPWLLKLNSVLIQTSANQVAKANAEKCSLFFSIPSPTKSPSVLCMKFAKMKRKSMQIFRVYAQNFLEFLEVRKRLRTEFANLDCRTASISNLSCI